MSRLVIVLVAVTGLAVTAGLLAGPALAADPAGPLPAAGRNGPALAADRVVLAAGRAGPAQVFPAQDPAPEPDPPSEPEPTGNPEPTSEPEPTRDPRPDPEPPRATQRPAPDPAAEAAEAAREEAARLARERAEAEAKAAKAAAKAAAQAAKAAAELAAAQRRAAEAWDSHGRPRRMLLVRELTVDVVSGGRLAARVPRGGGVMTLGALNRLAPSGWVALAGDSARLSSAVVLGPGTALDLAGVRTLRLDGGATLPEAASIYTGGGRLSARSVTVTSAVPGTENPMPPAAGRPFIVVTNGGRLDATDATFSDLGTLPADVEPRTGVQLNQGASGSLVRTTLARNTVGLRLSGSRSVRLDGLALAESAGDGLVLLGDLATTLRGVRAERNGGNGVLVRGAEADRAISEISTAGNKAYGLAVVGLVRARISGIATEGDGAGGLRLANVTQPVVTDFTATDQPVGIFTHVGSNGLVVDRARIAGGRRGMLIEKSTTGLQVRDTWIDRTAGVGMSVGGRDVSLTKVSVTGARTAIKLERGAAGFTAAGLSLSGGRDGLVASPGSTRVVLRDLVADNVGNDAVRTFSPDTQILGGRITGGDTGIVAAAAVSVTDTAVTRVHTGLRSRGAAPVTAERLGVAALAVGVDAAPGSPVHLRDSKVHALEALRGEVLPVGFNDLSLPPLNVLGAIGVPLIALALLLELVHVARQRRVRAGGTGRGRTPPMPPRPPVPPRPSVPVPAGAG
ncbi:hypothetical protein GCM10023321_45680 [Pseudonocardia eucalypti]|uniref:Right-handed parallel beta-helix repeat-containing protein n=1 Tax=Pseudonocardia eucalypti TaxID=648755 RepID=A0ABP9QGA0_9PSEU|nr:hypothetical protein [Pseudonocardia eucalypti]